MKHISKIAFAIILSLTFFACNESDTNTGEDIQNTSQEIFASKTIEIFEELTTEYFPKEDVNFVVYKDKNGFLMAKYELIGTTKKEVQMGSFAKTERRGDGGTTCEGKWSCGKAIYKCLENDQDALISEGACTGRTAYCVTCQDPK
ncbi:hypothetical protein [uncultured Polaribacter sp.]|uniref:hypothetical protein n=1 Tax=uncultured Polaribacter sp. TaxID=174711 RepID=UPI002615576D|nr:hypothetical protein [uncultured Polaribacter sp.]